jgi:hypothetical protein
MKKYLVIILVVFSASAFSQEKSSARQWIDQVLYAVKWDSQGPTIQSRNIYHLTLAMYEAWAFYHKDYEASFLGKKTGGYYCDFDTNFTHTILNVDSAAEVALNQASLRLMHNRWSRYSSKNRGVVGIVEGFSDLADSLNVDRGYYSADYHNGDARALGNYIAEKIIEFGMQDGSNESDEYEPKSYSPINPRFNPANYGTNISHNNRWQPISIRDYVNKRGEDPKLPIWYKLVTSDTDEFLTPEWGDVAPFAMSNPKIMSRDGKEYKVYLDPGKPPYLNYDEDSLSSENYKWGFVLNLFWSSHMDTKDGVMMDISPRGLAGVPELPESFNDYSGFYDIENGWLKGVKGIKKNPKTNKKYKKNMVLRGDYARVIAEYWVDGIFTYSPPGHWFQHLSETSYSKGFVRKWEGKGTELSPLEWDVKAYFTLGGALLDAGIASWGAKGYYDYVRPISAIRLMAKYGQCTDTTQSNYDQRGLPLIPGHIEVVKKGDSLAGENNQFVGHIKVYTWKGPEYIKNQDDDYAGVGWILAGNWWPYQRYSFVTPPFAGYVSGHSTFSACGAEVLTKITGDPYFPGGIKETSFKKNSFLEFEDGPTTDITLQWATYHDAANETCLSRIWGGIHPPADDIPGRIMGIEAANLAISKVNSLVKK